MYKHKADGQNGKNPTLRDMLATSKFANYRVEDMDEYTKKIRAMNLSDLHYHAIQLGIKPHSDRRRMERLLFQEFTRARSNHLAACNQRKDIIETEEQLEKRQKALDILNSTK